MKTYVCNRCGEDVLDNKIECPSCHKDARPPKPIPPSWVNGPAGFLLSTLGEAVIMAIVFVIICMIKNDPNSTNIPGDLSACIGAAVGFILGLFTWWSWCNYVQDKTCPKCGAYAFTRESHLCDHYEVPAIVYVEHQHYDSTGQFIGTTRTPQKGKVWRHIYEDLCHCSYCKELWLENRREGA